MKAQKKTAALPTRRSQGKKGTSVLRITSISRKSKSVNTLSFLRTDLGIPVQVVVDAVREKYPGFDASLRSKCEHPETYGVELVADAEKKLIDRFAPIKKRDKRRFACRVSCRLSDTDHEDLIRFSRMDGYETMQAWLAHQIEKYLERKRVPFQ